ncbi:MAG: hypothetical protein ACQESR_00840 [Planctomycetota bacterium]
MQQLQLETSEVAATIRGRTNESLSKGRRRFSVIFQAVELVRVESCPTQAVLPLVGLAADTFIRDRYTRRTLQFVTKPHHCKKA